MTKVRFVMRWKKHFNLTDAQGVARKPGLMCRGKRSLDHRLIWDARGRCWRKTGLLMLSVSHPVYPGVLHLVVSRPKGRKPWLLVTNEPLQSLEDAWHVVFAYAGRWQIEMSWRLCKTELAFESPRLWRLERGLC